MTKEDLEKRIEAEWNTLAQFLTEPKTRKEIHDELPILNLQIKLKRWVKEGKLLYYKNQWAFIYELANPVNVKGNSRIIRGFDTIRVTPSLTRNRNYVSGSTLSGVF